MIELIALNPPRRRKVRRTRRKGSTGTRRRSRATTRKKKASSRRKKNPMVVTYRNPRRRRRRRRVGYSSAKRKAAARKAARTRAAKAAARSRAAKKAARTRKRRGNPPRRRVKAKGRRYASASRKYRGRRRVYRVAAPARFKPKRKSSRKTKSRMRRKAGRWLAKYGNPRRRNPYLTKLNRSRRRRKYRRRRNPGGRGFMGKLRNMFSRANLVDAGWTLVGVGATSVLSKQLNGLLGGVLPGGAWASIALGAVAGAGASLLADRFLGAAAGRAVFRGALLSVVGSAAEQLAGGIYTSAGLPSFGLQGFGSWLSTNELPPSYISGMGAFLDTQGPYAAIGPTAASTGESFAG